MSESPGERPNTSPGYHRWQRALALLLCACAAAIFVRSTVVVDRSPELTFFYNLPPFFDGVQYFAEAASLASEGSPTIWINGERQPSIYPFGYSLLTAALIPFVQEPVAAAYLVNVIASALILVFTGLVTWRLHGLLPASVVVLLVSALPIFVLLGNSPMSGSSAGVVFVACVGSWLLYARGGRSHWGMLASFLVGVGVWFKTGAVFFVPLLLFGTLAPVGMTLTRRFRALVVHGGVAAIGVAPVLAYNWLMFGNPVLSGYHHWSGSGPMANIGGRPRFAVANIGPRLVDLLREALELPLAFNTANIFGSGSWIGAPAMVLLIVASTAALRKREWLCVTAGSSVYLLSMLCYYRYFGRLYFPLFLLGAMAVGPLVGAVTEMRPGGWKRLYAVALTSLLLASVLGFSRPGATIELPLLLRTDRFERQVAANFLLAKEVRAELADDDCLVVTDLLTPYVSAITGPAARVLSLEGERQFSHHRLYAFSVEARDAEISGVRRHGGCVIAALAGNFSELDERLPAGDGFLWETFYAVEHIGNRRYGAARLVPDAPTR